MYNFDALLSFEIDYLPELLYTNPHGNPLQKQTPLEQIIYPHLLSTFHKQPSNKFKHKVFVAMGKGEFSSFTSTVLVIFFFHL